MKANKPINTHDKNTPTQQETTPTENPGERKRVCGEAAAKTAVFLADTIWIFLKIVPIVLYIVWRFLYVAMKLHKN